ncbi:MAG: acetyl-CoA carboxylase biotin carboxylase subunit [Acidobacteria bacterium]|nr:acetyl-CoA carboxylase biotin carboxylase subunit [Acidobacteriota bacterium]
MRACLELGIQSVAVYSDEDRAGMHVRLADEAYAIGPAASRESYLRIDKLLDVAKRAGCDALHPGYGFLAENAQLPRACVAAGVTFIGPTAEAMEQMGSKTAARNLAKQANVPTVPGTLDPIEKLEDARSIARDTGYPVLLKAIAGGGGKGMRRVMNEPEMAAAWRDASSEATNAFGDGRLYLEKYLAHARHIEIQVLVDHHGNAVYLGERECSIQRRHQKVIEEAPSPVVDAAMRQRMGEAAVRLARAGGYTNAGTLEFMVDEKKSFYFLEMNTRLQVEHPVTEMVTGLDLVKLQIRVAAGERLPLKQEDITIRGHAIECRVYAEDPDNNFFPSPGKILARRIPAGPGIRMDDGVYPGWVVPNDYDPLLGKLIAWGADREEAIARMKRALDEYYVSGIKTNIGLFRRIMSEPDFLSAKLHTRWLDELLMVAPSKAANSDSALEAPSAEDAAVLAAVLYHVSSNGGAGSAEKTPAPESRWKLSGREELVNREPKK